MSEADTTLHTASPPEVSIAPKRFQVLALDGGGVKALFTAHILARLEEDLEIRVVDSFDLIAGTSAGGIVALALGAGMRPAEIVDRYTELVAKAFPRSRQRAWRLPGRLINPAYQSGALREALDSVFGDLCLGNSAKRLIVPSWDVQAGTVHIFKTPHHERLRRDWRTSMVDVAMATSAAPTFFAAAKVDNLRLIDGGVWANNPSVIAITEAVSVLQVPLSAMRVLNVGTIDQKANHPERLDTGGLIRWARPGATLLLTASSRGGQGTAEHLVGPSNFARFDANVPGGLFTLDTADPGALAGLATSVSRNLSPTYTARFGDHAAPAYTPMNGPGVIGINSSTNTSTQTGEAPNATR